MNLARIGTWLEQTHGVLKTKNILKTITQIQTWFQNDNDFIYYETSITHQIAECQN